LSGSPGLRRPRLTSRFSAGSVSSGPPSTPPTTPPTFPRSLVGINQLFATPDPRSEARQLLTLQGQSGTGLGLGLNVYPHRVLGFQFLFDRARFDIAGENPPHEVDLVWDSINFPFSDPVVREASISLDVPDTEGRLDELALSFNLTARFGASSAVSGSVSSGLTYFRFDSEAERLSAFAGYLGGHAVLFTELYQMSYSTESADALGFNVGGSVDFALGAHAAVFADGRFFWAPSTEAELTLDEIVSDSIPSVTVSQIDNYLGLPPISIDPSFFRILVGVKVRL
jgi:hypothetical protein